MSCMLGLASLVIHSLTTYSILLSTFAFIIISRHGNHSTEIAIWASSKRMDIVTTHLCRRLNFSLVSFTTPFAISSEQESLNNT